MKSKTSFLLSVMSVVGLLWSVSCTKSPIDNGEDPLTPPEDSLSTPGDTTAIPLSLNLGDSAIWLLRNESSVLSCQTTPEDTLVELSWSIDDESVAKVDQNGNVTALSPGKAVVRVSCGDVYAECKVTVFIGDKKPQNAYVGDYYLSDGSILSQSSSTAEIASMPVIGIVFCTDASRMGEAEKEALKLKGVEQPNGLVMSARQAPEPLRWYFIESDFDFSLNEEEIGMPNIIVYGDPYETYRMANNDLNGYRYYQSIKELRKDELAAGYYQVFSWVDEFETLVPSPEISTGWYLPSNGQWFDIIRGLAKGNVEENNLVKEGEEDFYWMNLGPLSSNMNDILSPLSSENKSEFIGSGMMFWTSSVASPSETRFISLDDNGFVCCYRYYKMEYMNVLCVLGF